MKKKKIFLDEQNLENQEETKQEKEDKEEKTNETEDISITYGSKGEGEGTEEKSYKDYFFEEVEDKKYKIKGRYFDKNQDAFVFEISEDDKKEFEEFKDYKLVSFNLKDTNLSYNGFKDESEYKENFKMYLDILDKVKSKKEEENVDIYSLKYKFYKLEEEDKKDIEGLEAYGVLIYDVTKDGQGVVIIDTEEEYNVVKENIKSVKSELEKNEEKEEFKKYYDNIKKYGVDYVYKKVLNKDLDLMNKGALVPKEEEGGGENMNIGMDTGYEIDFNNQEANTTKEENVKDSMYIGSYKVNTKERRCYIKDSFIDIAGGTTIDKIGKIAEDNYEELLGTKLEGYSVYYQVYRDKNSDKYFGKFNFEDLSGLEKGFSVDLEFDKKSFEEFLKTLSMSDLFKSKIEGLEESSEKKTINKEAEKYKNYGDKEIFNELDRVLKTDTSGEFSKELKAKADTMEEIMSKGTADNKIVVDSENKGTKKFVFEFLDDIPKEFIESFKALTSMYKYKIVKEADNYISLQKVMDSYVYNCLFDGKDYVVYKEYDNKLNKKELKALKMKSKELKKHLLDSGYGEREAREIIEDCFEFVNKPVEIKLNKMMFDNEYYIKFINSTKELLNKYCKIIDSYSITDYSKLYNVIKNMDEEDRKELLKICFEFIEDSVKVLLLKDIAKITDSEVSTLLDNNLIVNKYGKDEKIVYQIYTRLYEAF